MRLRCCVNIQLNQNAHKPSLMIMTRGKQGSNDNTLNMTIKRFFLIPTLQQLMKSANRRHVRVSGEERSVHYRTLMTAVVKLNLSDTENSHARNVLGRYCFILWFPVKPCFRTFSRQLLFSRNHLNVGPTLPTFHTTLLHTTLLHDKQT